MDSANIYELSFIQLPCYECQYLMATENYSASLIYTIEVNSEAKRFLYT